MAGNIGHADIVMLGTFAVWKLGSLQSRALPLARAIQQQTTYRVALVTTPWDAPEDAGSIDVIDGVLVVNTRATRPRAAPLAMREQLRWIDRLRPRVVHLFKPKGFGGLTAYTLRRTRKPVRLVVDTDDWEGDGGWNERNDYSLVQRRVFAWQEHSLVVQAEHVTAASRLLERRARRLRPRGDTVTYLPNGLERDWLDQLRVARQTSRHDTTAPTVLLYSRFAEFPADWVARFARELGAYARSPVRLSLVGDTGCMHVPESGPDVEVLTHGYVARERLPGLLAGATVAVYPYEDNLINRSKQSVKLLELMAAGCPVVASDVGEVAATLGSSGCLLPGSDPERFARATATMIGQPGRLATMGQCGQRRVEEHFRIESLAMQLAHVYERMGARRPC